MHRLLALIGLLAVGTVGSGCRSEAGKGTANTPSTPASSGFPRTPASSGFPRTLTDARGRAITLPAPPQRIVSLIPSDTEVLYALGAGDRIAAVTNADDYPPEVKRKPTINNVLTTDIEQILVYKPDLVMAFGGLNHKPIASLEALHIPVLVIEPKNLDQTYASIRLLGQAVGAEAKAEQIVTEMQTRLAAVQATVAQAKHRPRVLMMYGTDPIYTTGPDSFIDDLITQAGGQNVVDKPITTNILSAEEVVLRQPDVILCNKALTAKVKAMPGWAQSVPAVRNDRLYFDEPEDGALVRPTPRLVRGVEALARYLHPELKWPPTAKPGSRP
jgi:iron complex transport system substrate-binding protein